METPNKIYLEKDKETDKIHHLWGRSPVIHSGYEHIEYIHKDVLLEWAKAIKHLYELPINGRDVSKICSSKADAFQIVIDKLNSM